MQLATSRVPSLLTVLALLVALLVGAAPTAAASSSPVSVEVELTRLLNAERSARGLHPLRVDVRLVGSGRAWSASMSQHGRLAHDPNLAASLPPGTTRGGENVASTTATQDLAARLHQLFMGSEGHRRNLLDGGFTDVGVGVAQGNGRTYATQRFTQGAPAHVASAVAPLGRLASDLFGGGRAQHVVITRDDVFADALTAGPLAGQQGPVLLTPPGPVVHPEVRRALEHILPRGRTVWLVGGTSAVSSGVEQELRGAGWEVRRIGGSNRIQTAEAVARHVVARDGRPQTAMVATAWDWPDAVAGGAFGATHRAPVLLSNRDSVPGETRAALADFAPRTVAALGGASALSDAVVGQLGATRVAGASRQGTAAAIARDLWGYRDASAGTWIAVPAFGDDAWTWALGVAPLAASRGAATLLVGPEVSGEVTEYLRGLGYGGGRSAELLVHGPVPANVAEEVRSLLR